MLVGPYAGKKVSEAKPLIKNEMLAASQAMVYSEPEKQVGGSCEEAGKQLGEAGEKLGGGGGGWRGLACVGALDSS